MAKKVLYLLRGEHTDELYCREAMDEILECSRVQVELIKEIARKTRCTALFWDYISLDDAGFFNRAIKKGDENGRLEEDLRDIEEGG
jgi:hypothetical protein